MLSSVKIPKFIVKHPKYTCAKRSVIITINSSKTLLRWHNYHFHDALEEESKEKMEFSIFSNKEAFETAVFIRIYDYDRTEYRSFAKSANGNRNELEPYNRLFSNVMSICVAR